ncbi:hypothetical protein [Streptomyces werraensis]|uniref:hypothetical protein n=1 Tax=Streptomyces werraensis TaxID=68284 RepID=UPI0034187786
MCEPCGKEFIRRGAYEAMLVRLEVHKPLPKFIIVAGHRLVEDAEHGERCFDCGRTGTETVFKFSMLHGCRARPESVDHLALTGDIVREAANARAEESARLWYAEAAYHLGMPVNDWRTVINHESTCATFTVGDDAYRLRYGLAGHRITAEKLPNRGMGEPEVINGEGRKNHKQVVFRFHYLVSKYETDYFATYTPGREDVILYAPEGQIVAVLRLAGLTRPEEPLAEVTDAVCDACGPIYSLTFQDRIYQ